MYLFFKWYYRLFFIFSQYRIIILILKNKLQEVKGYDYILIDCSPSLGLLNQNALLASNEALIPTSTDVLGYKALKKIIMAIESLNHVFEHDCQVTKIVPTMHDKRLKVCKEVLHNINNDYYEMVCDPINVCSKLKEAPSKGQSIFKYAPNSAAAKDYAKMVQAVIRDEQKFDLPIEEVQAAPAAAKA